MKHAVLLVLGVLLASPLRSATNPEAEADRLASEKSWRKALEIYETIKPGAEDERRLTFKIADARWRAAAGSENADDTPFQQAAKALQTLVGGEPHDATWAQANESLGDLRWTNPRARNWGEAWPCYQKALDFWSGQSDLETARRRYLAIVWKASGGELEHYAYSIGNLPLDVLENAVKIAKAPGDEARARYLLARSLRYQGGDPRQLRRAVSEFEAALKPGKKTDWYDDALFEYAQMLEYQGRWSFQNGQPRLEPDLEAALKIYRRIVSEFKPGQTRYHDNARERIKDITSPSIHLHVPYTFLPDSDLAINVSSRNVKEIAFTLAPVALLEAIPEKHFDPNHPDSLKALESRAGSPVRRWTRPTGDDGRHLQLSESFKADPLPAGAYLLTASGGGSESRALALVTSAAIAVKTSPSQVLVYVCDAATGKPAGGAAVKIRYRRTEASSGEKWDTASGVTGPSGLWQFRPPAGFADVVAVSDAAGQPAIAAAYGYHPMDQRESWKIYAFTDRPAYRPGDKIGWKAIARCHDGRAYANPAGRWIRYELLDSRGNRIDEGQQSLDEFGAFSGELTLDGKAPLGEYRVQFQQWDEKTKSSRQYLGSAVLFRLEEFKLPEFKVAITTANKAYRTGDRVGVDIAADYYFGGPVAAAKVEYLVRQSPYQSFYFPPSDYPWLCKRGGWRPPRGSGAVVERGQTTTDASGKARFFFQTPPGSGQDFEYEIEARVTDSSRREIAATRTIRVTRDPYRVHLNPKHRVYQPQDNVEVEIKSLDANDEPLAVTGRVTVYRDTWQAPDEEDSRPLHARTLRVAPGYRSDKIVSRTLDTNAKGEARLEFKPEREGTYRVEWSSETDDRMPIRSQTQVFVCTKQSRDIGYRYGGVEIIPDRETYQPGDIARIMLVAPCAGTDAVFCVEGGDLNTARPVHFDGTVQLIELPIDETHIPNAFLTAFLVRDAQIHVDQREIVVPPARQFLKVEIEGAKPRAEPREEAELTLKVSDFSGKPVRAGLSLAMVDESVFYIQSDYAGDIREFFYSDKRREPGPVQSSFQFRPYEKLKWDEEKKTFQPDESLAFRRNERNRQAFDLLGKAEKEAGYADSSMGFEGRAGAMATRKMKSLAEAAVLEQSQDNKRNARMDLADADGETAAVVVRTDFRATALWEPALRTGQDGRVKVKVRYPDTLTAWKTVVRAAGSGSQVGMGETVTQTKKDLLVRLESPRFLTQGDEAVVSGIVHNDSERALSVDIRLSVEGLDLADSPDRRVKIAAHSQERIDWKTKASTAGRAKLTLQAVAGKKSDAMERSIPIVDHGIEKWIAVSGWTDPSQAEAIIKLNLPRERNPQGARLEVILTPSIATTCLDALPYLADYPYGCVEQTMSRFLPAVIVARALDDLQLDRRAVEKRIFGGIEPEHAAKTHPQGKHDLRKLDRMIRDGLDRLEDMRHSDGGWGWWKEGASDPFMTAYVVQGLIEAHRAGTPVSDSLIHGGLRFLSRIMVNEERRYDNQAWIGYAIALGRKHCGFQPDEAVAKQYENLWSNRDQLNAYTRSLLALSFHHLGESARAKTLVENLENGIQADDGAGTAHWGRDGIFHRWSDGGVESTAWALRAMLAVDPKNKRIPPAMNWLVKNRRGAQWSNTRDTAMAVFALTDYLRLSGELAQEFEYELTVNGKSISRQKISAATALDARSRFTIPEKLLRDGDNEIRIRKTGRGRLYHAAHLSFFSREEPITAAGTDLTVKREYFRHAGRATLLKGYVYDRVPLKDGDAVLSGDRVEVKLTIVSKNDYEYLVFEDLKPAGLEAVELRSGEAKSVVELKKAPYLQSGAEEPTGRRELAHPEFRDRKAAFFIDRLAEGVHTITYDLRAETPGEFHALPTLAHAMYVPEIRANGAETRIRVHEPQK